MVKEPETVEEAWAGFIWIAGLSLLALVGVLAHVTGLLRWLVRMIPRPGKPG